MAERLFRAHFTDGLHIGDPTTLTRLAAEVGVATGGVPPAVVRARLDRVRRLGITGVPVFLIEDLPPLTGCVWECFDSSGQPKDPVGPATAAKALLDQVTWWARVLRDAKATTPYTA
ncbi:hypothetical protein [Nonomuraea sp. NPDC050691]|uniref:hypothetical protein n=1 Tax=Nonomuraea sp. NPDC050691 TaxID=3155661 RepID=UPI00340E3AFB